MTDTSATPFENETIKTLLNRRSIRKFKPEAIDPEIVAAIEEAAQRAPSSQYLNDWSAIRVKSQELKKTIAKIGHQPYIAEAPLLYIFIADEHRNAAIARRKGVDVHSDEFTLNSNYRFVQAQNDAVLALHAMETAANGLGLGCVVLGSVLNDQAELIKLLHLPEFTYPILGLAIGKPDQAPALKPRMDRSAQFFDDAYPADDSEFTDGLDAFDDTVHRYYDLRNTERPVDAFSDQITKNATDPGVFSRNAKTLVESQGFRYDR
ncbi:nitroreductase family protein [Bifidobacterium sp. ESL0790]|uniref:nitroreductase family protein n=1 Tax=Bifidobacterium sp. ESL0790 TaxID=2983233 RepID=UPI0023F8C127|nr:nitroreductase family protein [Bifidobacterium sp. ESL0790]WEV72497.1 nitroreductase family protein [Bifidobacterium sp. ESL0790]